MSSSQDGNMLVVSSENNIYVIDVATGKVITTLANQSDKPYISPDGQRLALVSDSEIIITDIHGEEWKDASKWGIDMPKQLRLLRTDES